MSARVVVSHYWSSSPEWASYRNILRDPKTDESIGDGELLDRLLAAAGVEDGDEVEVSIKKTGRRPFGNRRVRLVKAHCYKREAK